MKHILKVASLQNLPDTRPLIAMDNNGDVVWYGTSDFIDLGLSVKWRNRNLGAKTIYDYGNYYAWGELETKTYYDWTDPNDSTQNYKYANGAYNKLTKYCPTDKTDYWDGDDSPDNILSLENSDNIAYQTDNNWGMPTKEELEELLTLPNKWISINGINGRVFCRANESGVQAGTIMANGTDYYFYDSNKDFGMWLSGYFNANGLKYVSSIADFNKVIADTFSYQEGYEGSADVTTMLFKDENHQELAVAGTDYQFGSFPEFNQNTMLFIPASGYKYRGQFDSDGSLCNLWSSSLYADNPYFAWLLNFNSDYINMTYDDRRYGFTVRPVQD